jgi:hypothetical protein
MTSLGHPPKALQQARLQVPARCSPDEPIQVLQELPVRRAKPSSLMSRPECLNKLTKLERSLQPMQLGVKLQFNQTNSLSNPVGGVADIAAGVVEAGKDRARAEMRVHRNRNRGSPQYCNLVWPG